MSTKDSEGETPSERDPVERPSQRLHGLYRADLRPFEPVSDAQYSGRSIAPKSTTNTITPRVQTSRRTWRAIKGLHEPIVTDELFDRVQEVRGWRTRVVKPGPPSDEYLLLKLLRCERCGARMHGTRGSKTAVRRYMCSTRRYGHSCGGRIVKAEALEGQLID